MSKHIFVSQSEFDMGRNRGNKRLIAILDGVKLKPTELPEVSFCPHIDYCAIVTNRVTNKKCLFGEGYRGCRVAQFYEKNPNYGRNR